MKKISIILLCFFISTLIACNNNPTTLTEEDNNIVITYYALDQNVNFSDNNFLDVNEQIISLESGLYHSILLTSLGRVFTWGDNEFGQLGNETLEENLVPTDITHFFSLNEEEKIIDVSIGALHTAALTSDHRIFVWGYNGNSQLGDGTFGPLSFKSKPKDITSEFQLSEGEYIESIELGTFHSSALTSNGRLFLWGNNQSGQIGNGTNSEQIFPLDITPSFNLTDGETINFVELANLNTAIITSKHRVFIWGDNTNGQIGNNTYNDSNVPIDITPYFDFNGNEYIEKLSLGTVHVGVLTSQGNIFTWGYDNNGQPTKRINEPHSIMGNVNLDENEIIMDISLGGSHSSFLTSDNNLYVWGLNLHGELGDNSTQSQDTPILINDFIPIDDGDSINLISLGTGNSFLTTNYGKIYSWGYNSRGQLGINSKINVSIPTQVFLYKIEQLLTEEYDQNSNISLYYPIRNQYEINQWYIDKNLKNSLNLDHFNNNDINLYSQWRIIT